MKLLCKYSFYAYALVIICMLLSYDSYASYRTPESYTERHLDGLSQSIEDYKLDMGHYPANLDMLVVNSDNSTKWNGPYFDKLQTFNDGWGRIFIYQTPGLQNKSSFDLYSIGEDGISKSKGNDIDDINNWDKEKRWRNFYDSKRMEINKRNTIIKIILSITCSAVLIWLIIRFLIKK